MAKSKKDEYQINRDLRKAELNELRRKQIIDAAHEIFLKKGYSGATMPEIARRAGVATGTIYLYYPSKRDLFADVIDKIYISPSVKITEKDSDKEVFRKIFIRLKRRYSDEEKGVVNRAYPLLADVFGDSDLRAMVENKALKPFVIQLEKYFRAKIASGEFRKFEPALVARAIASMIEGMGMVEVWEGQSSPLYKFSNKVIEKELTELILYGLINRQK